MDSMFYLILNMSIIGAFVIAAISLARLPLRKAPKTISYCMWGAAGFRLVFPFSVESAVSLIPFNSRLISQGNDLSNIVLPDGLIPGALNGFLAAAAQPGVTVPVISWFTICAYLWLTGVIVMIACGVVSVIRLKRRISGAASVIANVFETERVRTPFILGFFPPVIYIPAGLSEQEKKYVIMHESKHIMRRDHITKVIGYFILCIHWFNPLVWVAFKQMSADMEMSCDESVLKNMGREPKIIYAQSLLKMAVNRRYVSNSLIAFGGKGVKKRVKNILRLRRHSGVVVIAAVVLATVFSLGLSVDKPGREVSSKQNTSNAIAETQSQQVSQSGFITGFSTSETYTNSLGRVPGSKKMQAWRFYEYMDENGNIMIYAYVSID